MQYLEIQHIRGRTILDSRGWPTVEADVVCADGTMGRASVPAGASIGCHEALEIRDHDENRFLGRDVSQAVRNIQETIAPPLMGHNAFLQRTVDQLLCDLDATPKKERLGANATLAVSLAVADAATKKMQFPLYRYLGGSNACRLPMPMLNVINGGQHAKNNLEFQEFMIVCHGFSDFREALRAGVESYQELGKLLVERGYSTLIGDEGGFAAPEIQCHGDALELILRAIEKAGYTPGKHISLALDIAASEFYDAKEEGYFCRGLEESTLSIKKKDEMIQLYEQAIQKYPILSIEDGLAEDDWEGWKKMTATIGEKVLIIGDDLLVTNPKRLRCAIDRSAANGILVKMNQIGTLSETMDCIAIAQSAGWKTIVSHRSGETEDTSIAHLAVGAGTPFIKTGAPCRGERTSKYNMLLRIEEHLGKTAKFASLR